ncbi:hypothetical protein GE09DRAFT_1115430 [Coniochaeta sp. 2T2.1]|nr:hypothetical protein GE09DRAFT_1115430 [Coniochaeta sp. 2T2.1]
MASKGAKKGCVGSPAFDPDERVHDAAARGEALAHLEKDEFRDAISSWFKLPKADRYVYHAITSVLLSQVQDVVNRGRANGLHDWYRNETGEPLPPPSQPDIEAYISLFLSTTNTASSLKGFASNAKKGSVRLSAANHLLSNRYLHPSLATTKLAIPKAKKPPPNPYFDFWAWSARNLEWCGPCPEAERKAQGHHVLPILMHHFGCVVPSYEALEVLRIVADGRKVADVGSGNGYWTFMLRQHKVADVVPVDNAQSEWRVNWVGDTVVSDGAKWLARRENKGGKDMVLLMVYPIVGGGVAGGVEGGFTRDLLRAYEGDTVAVVGTQNHNGYTGFSGTTMAEYMEREHPDWVKVVQIPLPSFAGKDEALFVFQRGERAPPKEAETTQSTTTEEQ